MCTSLCLNITKISHRQAPVVQAIEVMPRQLVKDACMSLIRCCRSCIKNSGGIFEQLY